MLDDEMPWTVARDVLPADLPAQRTPRRVGDLLRLRFPTRVTRHGSRVPTG